MSIDRAVSRVSSRAQEENRVTLIADVSTILDDRLGLSPLQKLWTVCLLSLALPLSGPAGTQSQGFSERASGCPISARRLTP